MQKHRLETPKHRHLRLLNNARARRYYQRHLSVEARKKSDKRQESTQRKERNSTLMNALVSGVGYLVDNQKQQLEKEKKKEDFYF